MTAPPSPAPVPPRMRRTIPPTTDPPSPRPIVAQIGIGSGPGTASRARPPTTSPQSRIAMMNSRSDTGPSVSRAPVGSGRRERAELAAEVLDLVAELRRVLEPELPGGVEHPLFEGDHELLELGAIEALDRPASPRAPGHVRGFEGEEL